MLRFFCEQVIEPVLLLLKGMRLMIQTFALSVGVFLLIAMPVWGLGFGVSWIISLSAETNINEGAAGAVLTIFGWIGFLAGGGRAKVFFDDYGTRLEQRLFFPKPQQEKQG